MFRPALVVLSRWPGPGRCKTRLGAKVGHVKAACIQDQLLRHTLSVIKPLEEKSLVEIKLAISGVGPRAASRLANCYGIKKITNQGEGNLGMRMRRQFLKAQTNKYPTKNQGRPTILIGTDVPTLCERDLIEAIIALKTSEMVIGPASDGGYWLIGLSQRLVHPVITWPFSDIPWGTNYVLNKTLAKAKSAKVSIKLIQEKSDLDHIEDLSSWAV